jgi:hypothetical protein
MHNDLMHNERKGAKGDNQNGYGIGTLTGQKLINQSKAAKAAKTATYPHWQCWQPWQPWHSWQS